MKEEILNMNHEMVKSKLNLKIILWWAGTFLGKSLRNIMNKVLSLCNIDSELPRLVKASFRGSLPPCPQC